MKKNVFLIIAITVFLLAPAGISMAQYTYIPMEKIPGFEGEPTDFPNFLLSITKFAIWTVGIAALLMITIGGFWYMTSAGNTSQAETAKKIITDALLGLIVALAAWLLLYVINPDLVNVNLKFKAISPPSAAPATTTAPTTKLPAATGPCESPNLTAANCCKPGIKCKDCINCHSAGNTVNCKENLCFLNESFLSKLQNANKSVPLRISEPWPPTYNHRSACHQTGTCADITPVDKSTAVDDVKKLYDALRQAGLKASYESSNCTPYTAAGIKCTVNPKSTGPHFHVS